jgi:hypothetical protein
MLYYLDELPMKNVVNFPPFDLAFKDQMKSFFNLVWLLSGFVILLMDVNPAKRLLLFLRNIA